MKRVFISVVVAAVAALGILPATSVVPSGTTTTTTTTGPAIHVNPLSQHSSHCAQPPQYFQDCFVTLKNQKSVGVSWWMEDQSLSSGNPYDYSLLYANGTSGDRVSGYLTPGQSVTVEIGTDNCAFAYGQYWTWIVGSSSGSTTFAPQATILNCS